LRLSLTVICKSLYVRELLYRTKFGEVTRDVPPLVTPEVFAAARSVLKTNLSRNTSKQRVNILRGMLKCGGCGGTFICRPLRTGVYYYSCSSRTSVKRPDPAQRCNSILLRAERIEDVAWKLCKDALDHFPTLDDWRQIVSDWVEGAEESSSRSALEAALDEVEAGRERILALVRHATITMDEATRQLDAGRKEEDGLRRRLDALSHREEDRQKWLTLFEREAAQIEELKTRMVNADPETRHEIIKRLLTGATVETRGKRKQKAAQVRFK
jgi:Recombinase zinc beta ribbon domain